MNIELMDSHSTALLRSPDGIASRCWQLLKVSSNVFTLVNEPMTSVEILLRLSQL